MSFFTKLTQRTLLLGAILATGAGTAWADNADFENALPEGWETVGTMQYYERAKTGDYSIGNASNQGWDTNRGNYIKTTMLEGTVTFWIRSYASNKTGYVTLYTLSEDGTTVGDKLQAFSSSSTTFAEKTYTLTEPTRLAIVINYAHLDNMTYTPYVQADGPAMKVTGDTNGAYAFSLGLEGTTATFNVKSSGTETLNATASVTGGYTIDWTSADIEAGESKDLVVTMTTGGEGTLTISGNQGIDPVEIALSGTVRDANKIYVDFDENAMPSTWSFDSGWSTSNGFATIGSTAAYIRSGKIVSTGEDIIVQYKGNGTLSWYSYGDSYKPVIAVYWATTGNESNADWTQAGTTTTLSDNDIHSSSYTIPAEAKYIAIYGKYLAVDYIYGLAEPLEPYMVFSASDYDFGVITEATTSTAFTVQNTGLAKLTGLSITSDNSKFTVNYDAASIEAGESVDFTITMAADAVGVQSATISVSADGFDAQTFTVSGCVMDENAFIVDFNDGLPTGWTNASWTFADGAATGKSSSAYLTTPKLQFAEGDFIVIKAKAADTYSGDYITVQGSTDDGESWTAYSKKIELPQSSNPQYATYVVNDIPTTVNKLRFVGYYVTVDEIAGLTYDQNAPALAVSPTTEAAFGKVKAQPEAKTYTVTNAGTGTMSGTITTSDDTQFTVSESAFSLGAGESMTFDIALVFDENYGDKAATITVTPEYDAEAAVTINATATTADPNVWEEDFESGDFANGWISNGWSISTPGSYNGGNGTKMAGGSSKTATLITPRLVATEGQQLSLDLGGAGASYPLTIEWSADRNEWTSINEYTEDGTITIDAPTEGNLYLRFTGWVYIDNIQGFKLDMPAHDANIASYSIPTTGNQYVEYTASVTVKEQAGKAEELTAKFFIGETQFGEDAVETVEANGTKTFTVSFTPSEAVSGDAYFTISNDDLSLESEKVAVEIAAAPVISEDAEWTQTSGTLPVAVVKYTAQNGWNTIALPFALTSDILTSLFGEGYQAYELKSHSDGKLVFSATSSFYAGYPYLVYTENAPEGQSSLQVNNVSLATANSDTRNSASLAATYVAAEEAWGVNADGTIATGTVKPLHAIITMPEGFEGTPRIAFNVEVGANEWASVFTAHALDFQAVEAFKAYTATVDVENSTVTINPVENVQKNTGVVINAAAATYAVPLYIGESSTGRGDLKGSATEATTVTSDYKFYGLAYSEGYVQFTRIAEGGYIGKGKAYLQLPADTEANAFSVVFGDATSISQLRSTEDNGNVFDLNGRQMSGTNLKKGLYIKNGKKVLVK